MKRNLLVFLLTMFCLNVLGQFEYGNALYAMKFETPIGCKAEFQSNNPNFNSHKLKMIIPILGFPSDTMGYYHEFGGTSIFPYNKKFAKKKDYEEYALQTYNKRIEDTERLLNLEMPTEFDTLKQAMIQNRLMRMEYSKILLDWVTSNNDGQLVESLRKYNISKELSDSLDLILLDEVWDSKFLRLQVRVGNLFNTINFYRIIQTRPLQNELFEKYNIRIVEDPDCFP